MLFSNYKITILVKSKMQFRCQTALVQSVFQGIKKDLLVPCALLISRNGKAALSVFLQVNSTEETPHFVLSCLSM